MSQSLKLISVNIERDRHLDLVIPFLQREKPDVVCVQELLERDVSRIAETLGMHHVYDPMFLHHADGNPGIVGIGTFSKHPITAHTAEYYRGPFNPLEMQQHAQSGSGAYLLHMSDIEKGGEMFRIGTTHFTWTRDGEANELQREDMQKLLRYLSAKEEFVLCGDFNAPRGKEMFSALAQRYADNIPAQYMTSIDGAIHRKGPLPLMVDGLFTTPGYRAADVRLQDGVSDHMAIVATISKN